MLRVLLCPLMLRAGTALPIDVEGTALPIDVEGTALPIDVDI